MPPNSRRPVVASETASLLQRFDVLLEALRPVLDEDRLIGPDGDKDGAAAHRPARPVSDGRTPGRR